MGTQQLQLSQEDISKEQLWPSLQDLAGLRLLSFTAGPQPAPTESWVSVDTSVNGLG